jgi:hypothetical protein
MQIEPQPDQKGDRVRVGMSGKFVALALGGAPFPFLDYYNGFLVASHAAPTMARIIGPSQNRHHLKEN